VDGWLLDGAADLLLGGRCVGCDRPGRVLCPDCLASLGGQAAPRPPVPVPAGLVECWSAGVYDGALRAALLAHKERAVHALRAPLGSLLAAVVASALPRGDLVVLVPVPSRPGVARGRGHDPTLSLARTAAGRLRVAGHDVRVAPLLRSSRGVADQAGLGAEARAANLAWSLRCAPGPVRRLAERETPVRLVLCDDVLTTGATLREAQRALEAVGLRPRVAVTVAATRRRSRAPARSTEGPPFVRPDRGLG